jgi:serine/threonine-protein kinase
MIDGKYEIVEQIGRGGMGVVYRAKHTLMDRVVALKVLHPHLVENEEFLKRFRHEAQVASKLNHPNAVMIYDFGIVGKAPYLVMEFVQGETLKDLISKTGALPVQQLEQIMTQVMSALVEAHRIGIVHRDLKPDNFILSKKPDGTILARVLDFGIAKLLQTADSKAQTLATQAGTFFGTPRYASPEQALGKELDARADIYALGVILYEALTGEVPFDAPSMMELLLKHLNQPPPAVRTKYPQLGISQKVEEVVLKCLEKERDKRFQSVQELSKAFKEAVILSDVRITGGSNAPIIVMGVLGVLSIGALSYFGLEAIRSSNEPIEIIRTADSSSSADYSSVQAITHSSSSEADVASMIMLITPEPTAKPVESSSSEASSSAESVSSSEEAISSALSSVSSEAFSSLTPTLTPSITPTPNEKIDLTNPVELIRKADQLYRSKSYSKAIPLYDAALSVDSKNKKARLNLGICYLRMGSMDIAFVQFKKAFDLDRRYPPTLFNLACYYALSGQKEAALKWLQLTIDQEPAAKGWARSEPDLASIKSDPDFKELVR